MTDITKNPPEGFDSEGIPLPDKSEEEWENWLKKGDSDYDDYAIENL
jgi:hypothetical protein